MYTFDLNGRFTYANRGLLSLWQKPLEAVVGKNFCELEYPNDLGRHLQRQVEQVIETRKPTRDQTPYAVPAAKSATTITPSCRCWVPTVRWKQ